MPGEPTISNLRDLLKSGLGVKIYTETPFLRKYAVTSALQCGCKNTAQGTQSTRALWAVQGDYYATLAFLKTNHFRQSLHCLVHVSIRCIFSIHSKGFVICGNAHLMDKTVNYTPTNKVIFLSKRSKLLS